jgi:hypothetical protein
VSPPPRPESPWRGGRRSGTKTPGVPRHGEEDPAMPGDPLAQLEPEYDYDPRETGWRPAEGGRTGGCRLRATRASTHSLPTAKSHLQPPRPADRRCRSPSEAQDGCRTPPLTAPRGGRILRRRRLDFLSFFLSFVAGGGGTRHRMKASFASTNRCRSRRFGSRMRRSMRSTRSSVRTSQRRPRACGRSASRRIPYAPRSIDLSRTPIPDRLRRTDNNVNQEEEERRCQYPTNWFPP